MEHSASDFLRSEHREVEGHLDTLLDALKHLSPERVHEIGRSVENIRSLVVAHMDVEERVFYPATEAFAKEFLSGMLRQHEDMREADRVLGQLLSEFPEAPADRDMGELYRLGIELHDAVQVHIVDEEEQLLRLVDERLSREQQESLLAAMQGSGGGNHSRS